jgi:hypothetical protein
MHFLPAILIVLAFQFLLHAKLLAAAATARARALQHKYITQQSSSSIELIPIVISFFLCVYYTTCV